MQLRPGQYSRGPPVTKAQRGEPRLAAREAGTGGCSSEEAMGTLGEPHGCGGGGRAARLLWDGQGLKPGP